MDITEFELAFSVIEQAAHKIIKHYEELDQDGKDDPSNRSVYNLAVNSLHAIEQYRAERITPEDEQGL